MEELLLLKVQELWNKELFYQAHEVLEDIWKLFPKNDKYNRNCYQGLIRLAIAYNHYQKGNLQSSLRVLKMSYEQLLSCDKNFRGIDLQRIITYLEKNIQSMENDNNILEFPEFVLNTYKEKA